MTVEILREPDIPEAILRLLATPVSRSQQTWYLGSKTGGENPRWLIATLWRERPREVSTPTCWGISLRGEADAALARPLVDALVDMARKLGCAAYVTDAVAVGAPFDRLLQAVGFVPLRSYRTVQASTIATLRGVGLGVDGAPLKAAGWSLNSPRADELPLLAAMFLHELNQVPPHLLHLIEDPQTARGIDESLVLQRGGHPVAALVARRVEKTIDVQGLVCHPRWRKHRAFSWLLAERAAPWPLIADRVLFSYPEANAGMADIARRIEAHLITRRRDLILKIST